MIHLVWIMLALLLLLCNAFFVAAEFAMVRLRSTRVQAIQEQYGLRGRMLYSVHQHLDAYLSACQLGITLASLGLGWIGEPAFARLFEPVFSFLGIVSPELIKALSFFIAFLFISFLHIVIGELMPKSLAIRQSEKISLWTALPLYGFYWSMYPAIWVLNGCSNFFLRLLKLHHTPQGENAYSTEELKLLFSAGHLHGDLREEEADIMAHTLDFADLRVTEVMRPRAEMVMLDRKEPMAKIMAILMQYRYSRYPVYDSETQSVVGVIHVKDILPLLYRQEPIQSLEPFLRPILKVSHTELALDLLKQFREGKPHFALVYSEYKTLSGFITLDNLLQILVGRIQDEFHLTEVDWVKEADGTLIVKGSCSLYALEQLLGCTFDTGDEDIQTLAGLIFHRLGDVPRAGESFDFPEFSGVIEVVEGSRIVQVRVYLHLGDRSEK